MEEEFKPFHETYAAVMFSMSLGMIYPNPATNRKRLLVILMLFLVTSPLIIIILLDVYQYWLNGNTIEIIRHIGIAGPFMAGIMKMCLLNYKRVEAKIILDIVNEDYATYNMIPERFKPLIKSYIKNTLTYQRVWMFATITIISTFLLTTSVLNTYEHLFKSDPKKYMIYDVNLPNKEPGAQLETPYFEILFAYMTFFAIVFFVNFSGYDGFMICAVNHACMRIELFCLYVEEAMEYQGQDLRRRIAYAVNHQCETFKLIQICQSTFNSYLGMVYIVVTLELCLCIYLIMEGYEFDYKFTSFSLGTILHIYLPCRIADKLKSVCADTSTRIYCCGWENMYDLSVRRSICFMIARAQCPIRLTAFGIITYEMDLFVSTMKTAYSLYTLINSQ